MEVQVLVSDERATVWKPASTASTDEGQTYALLEPGQTFQVQVKLKQTLTQSPKFRQQLKEYQAQYGKAYVTCDLEVAGARVVEYLPAPSYVQIFKGHRVFSADRSIQAMRPFAAQSIPAFTNADGAQEAKVDGDTGLISVKAYFTEVREGMPAPATGRDLLEEESSGAGLTAGNEKFGKKPALSFALGKACDKALCQRWTVMHNRKQLAEGSARIDSESAVAARHLQGGICLDADSQTRLKKYLRGPPAVINLIKQERHAHKKYKCDLTGGGAATWIKFDEEATLDG
ncbi:hypothetical protein WJX73_005710 [Symbiochloris irregularis]|uniref:Uncharacterized protein n=1 Tax=Symbiochloris irregularis TaxID=706552 RepID=A0AAW1PDR8_9CHLO